MKFKSFAEALSADRPIPANDNKTRKPKQPRYRGTLPALRWLFDNHPDLAPAMAAAKPKTEGNWSADLADGRQEIRPTVGELLKAAEGASQKFDPTDDRKNNERISLGSLKFLRGRLIEWAVTKKGHRLRPVDRVAQVGGDAVHQRDPARYLKTRATAPSPFDAYPLPRNMSGQPMLPPMLDPLNGVAEGRRLLQSLGIDGTVPLEKLPIPATRCSDAVAKNAVFLGGISSPKGNTSSGAQAWEAPEATRGEAATVIEEVFARGTLRSIGLRLGYSEDYADRAGKAALIEAARVLAVANDNKVSIDVPKCGAL
ncbi:MULTISPECIES: hypothetical protein [Rhizobium]|uniref:hypothetical protein n=1 Tax=Rhizobium TaxID=379 RepID=UPI001A922508|nr:MULTISPECIES: hypothetical protein [Rhizobium]MBX5017484.1 hypothetical protein [Rhizobium lentis]MBX5063426.1 hypothetical protein [Rhizobium lentis]MBX5075532.1 hypothetical protein [Rhizobium lentis]MBX5213010.1 hypothetical protein [Rhizobium sp. NLR9a]MBX5256036.1 hypothetical protein [Rhizobium sp. NLR16b]